MDQARTTISKIFNGEPQSYTRFSLTQNMEGGDSQVEMKLSPEADEEVGTNGVGEHLNHQREYYKKKPARSPRDICFLIAATLLIFIIGYLIGYLVHRKQDKTMLECDQTQAAAVSAIDDDDLTLTGDSAPKQLDWSDVRTMLADRLTVSQIDASLSEFARNDHQAGSPGDEVLANKVLKRFKDNNMDTWVDEHSVQLQLPPASGSNTVEFRGQSVGSLQGYLAYSGNGTAQGPVVYAHYGQKEDFDDLKDLTTNLTGRIILVRAGKISFAEKVANAASMDASGVLIYPDPADYALGDATHLFGHVHLGTGDPYTTGFPSFQHTQFPPTRSSGLPSILAQTITASMAKTIMRSMGGRNAPRVWARGELSGVQYKLGDDNDIVSMGVNNVLVETNIHNVFGVIKGVQDEDRYVVIGAQRDAWGPGFAKSTVGTTLLVELARSISNMVREGRFMPRRSVVFASWSAGEYGSVGATEWLEGYLTSLNMKAYTYISLDGVVTGSGSFQASGSPLLSDLLTETLKEVKSVGDAGKTIYSQATAASGKTSLLEPLQLTDPVYPFITFSGIPSVSFQLNGKQTYPYLNTLLDTRDKLNAATSGNLAQLIRAAGQVAGHMALRLVHDHLLKMGVETYSQVVNKYVIDIMDKVNDLKRSSMLPRTVTTDWLTSARGSFGRSARELRRVIRESNLEDVEQCRKINDRIMRVEANLLSPYVSPTTQPFRHILLGTGSHTLTALVEQLDAFKSLGTGDVEALKTKLALTTWTIQTCANALAGDVWELDNDV
ncbi:transferrin receptor 1a [Engraulis encrasicolus]|uniref:transferrin receptor 1a n=1 Tax=Engraulis encrasicolus TaxID=184585 RepID=UPI002FCEB1CF